MNNKCNDLWFNLRLEELILTWKSDIRGRRNDLSACSLLLEPSNVFFLVERDDFDLKVWSFRGQWHVLVLVLFFRDFQMFPSHWKGRPWLGMLIFETDGMFVCLFSSYRIFICFLLYLLEETVLILKVFLALRKFDFRESLSLSGNDHFFLLGSDAFLFRNAFFSLIRILPNERG